MTRPRIASALGSNALRAAVLGLVVVGQCLGVFLLEVCEAGEQLLRVDLVERGRLAQFGHGIGERLLFLRVDVRLLRHRLGERIEASAQIRECRLEGRQRRGIAALSAQTRPR